VSDIKKTTHIDTKPAYLYSRVSTLKQEDGEGIERQKRLIEDFISKEGFHLVDTYEDVGKSAYKGEHEEEDGGLGQFMQACRDGHVKPDSCLVIEQLDRLSRMGLTHARGLLSDLVRLKVNLAIVRMGMIIKWSDKGDFASDVQIGNCLDMAWKESEYKSLRVLATFDIRIEKARLGLKWTSKCPWWMDFDADKKDFYENEYTHTARKIIDLCLNNCWGAHRICNYLNEDIDKYPRPPPQSTKKNSKRKIPEHWTKTSIYYVLNSRAMHGEWQPMRRQVIEGKRKDIPLGEPLENYYMPIATETEFYRIKQSFEKNTKVSKDGIKRGVGGEKGRVANLYRGLTKCWDCGTALVVKKGYSKDYLSCNDQGGRCNSKSVVYGVFEEKINASLKTNPSFKRPEKQTNNRLEIIALEAEITKQNDLISKNNIMIESLGDDVTPEVLGMFAKKINSASIKKNELAEKIEILKAENESNDINIEDLLNFDLTDYGQRETYNKLISRDIELITICKNYVLFKRKDIDIWFGESLLYDHQVLLPTSEGFAKGLFDNRKSTEQGSMTDNYSFTIFEDEDVEYYLDSLNQHEIAGNTLKDMEGGKITFKRGLRLLKDKHQLDDPAALLYFKGMFIRGAIYKLMNLLRAPLFHVPINQHKEWEDYLKYATDGKKTMRDIIREKAEIYYRDKLI